MEQVEHRFSRSIDAEPSRVFDCVAELDRYPDWLDLVDEVERCEDPVGDRVDGAWLITLRARIGPLARSKRLRMIRTVLDEPTRARFERKEIDGRSHASWVLDATVEPGPSPESAVLTMDLHYDGRLWSSVLDGVLAAQVDAAVQKLETMITRPTPGRSGSLGNDEHGP